MKYLDDVALSHLILKPGLHFQPKRGTESALCSNWKVGLEYEFEAVGHSVRQADVNRAGWHMVTDGSLRNEGYEFIFDGAAGGAEALHRIASLEAWSKEYKWATSPRTSLHVHMDMRGVTLSQFKRIMAVYCLVEPALFTFVGREREKNIYCVPHYRADRGDADKIALMYEKCRSLRYATRKNETMAATQCLTYFRSVNKYAALNLKPLVKFGSIEFRQAPILNQERTIQWLNLLMSMGHYAIEATSAKAIISHYLEVGAITFTKEVFGKYYAALNIRELNHGTGMSLQRFNNYVDVISQAERFGGVPSISKVNKNDGWGIRQKIMKRRAEPRIPDDAQGSVMRYASMLDIEPEG